jgi:hypothetical protein
MEFRGKPNSSVTTQSGRIGKTDSDGLITVPEDTVLSQFTNRMKRGGLRLVHTCPECGEKVEDLKAHSKTHVKKPVKKKGKKK